MSEEKTTRKCDECKYCCLVDNGYSNYTVEGTEVVCLLRKHPDGDFDQWYGEEIRLNYAENCTSFVAGNSVGIDVDRDEQPYGSEISLGEAYSDDEEIQGLINTVLDSDST